MLYVPILTLSLMATSGILSFVLMTCYIEVAKESLS